MIVTPQQCSTRELKRALARADAEHGKHTPDNLKPVISAVEAELKRREDVR